jgi:hypothetical protein
MVKGELQSTLADRYTIEHELGRGGMATSPIPSTASCSSPSGRSGTSPGPSGSGDSRRSEEASPSSHTTASLAKAHRQARGVGTSSPVLLSGARSDIRPLMPSAFPSRPPPARFPAI